ncbi:cupin domain-containing protein [bacterium]|nr:MAG: cupin domain-containing protein [bacterium]
MIDNKKLSADDLISILKLQPHPEGGAFRETYRSIIPAQVRDVRSVCTAIYFLIRQSQTTAWHRVKSDEIYHFYYGAPIELALISPDGNFSKHILCTDVKSGERPQIMVPANYWQSARSLGAFTLIGCTVSPGFDFLDFEMITIEKLEKMFPQLKLA